MQLLLRYCPLVPLLLLFLFPPLAQGKVLRVELTSRESVLKGKSWGDAGAYELLRGKVYFGIDPNNRFNQQITDLALAPRNPDGLVEAWGDLIVLQPVNRRKGRGTALVEVSNRGGKFTPTYFNAASRSQELDVNDPTYWGDGLVMRQGLTIIWIGWQCDVPMGEGLRLEVPIAKQADGSSLTGWARSDWTVDEPAAFLGLGHRNLEGYPATDLTSSKHQLTERDGRDAPRRLISRNQWQFARLDEEGKVQPSPEHILLQDGFRAGKIYELVYQAADPKVVGLGLAAIRDIISYAKYDRTSPFRVTRGIAAGVSQTGRFLRHFLYQGFNTDEGGRKAYDGMYIITAGAGRGSFNHRFAQPSRDGHRYSAFLYPTDIFPFSSQAQTDPVTGVTDGLLQHLADPTHAPRIFYVNTGYEYWGRSASLLHTDLYGTADITPLPNERIYHMASGQHYVDAFPPRQSVPGGFQGNPLELRLTYRALLIRLVEWAEGKAEAPPSRYPTFAAGQLKRVEALGFPAIPGVQVPQVTNHPYRTDYGDRWPQGIIDRQPPQLGYAFPVVVPALDELGNERSGIQSVELRVPLATYTPWSLRQGYPAAQNELIDFRGYWLPLPATEAIRRATGDPRSSIEALYPTPEAFQQEVTKAANQLVQEGFLLPEDRTAVAARQLQYWDFLHPAGAKAPTQGPANGSLIIIGGGRLDSVFYQKFMELAGGPDAPIVIIPTAGEDSFLERKGSEEQIKNPFAAAGFHNITVLHTRDPQVANTDAFTTPLKQAKGVWFSGGRQWRLADSYLHTKTQEAINDVLARGGVIAGTSAGASIQGSLLVRGDTNGNTLMLGDHTEGFGLVSQVAIDQHLLARNRQFDMFSVTKQYPDLLGIGLDENTGIVVQGNMFSVIGKSYVAIYNSEETASGSDDPSDGMPRFLLLHQGDRFNLVERRLIRD